ncbi:MAG: MoaD/ThiS family protein [Puniceicoccales bacterium]
MKRVTVLYFAQLSAQAGCAEEILETDAEQVSQIFADRTAAHGFSLPIQRVRFARNEEFCQGEDEFADGDVIAIMPPMSGG